MSCVPGASPKAHAQCPDPAGGGGGEQEALGLSSSRGSLQGIQKTRPTLGAAFHRRQAQSWSSTSVYSESRLLQQPFGEPEPVRKITDRPAQCWGGAVNEDVP